MAHKLVAPGDAEESVRHFLIKHEGHPGFEEQRGEWSIYMRCPGCEVVETREVDNEARQRAVGRAIEIADAEIPRKRVS